MTLRELPSLALACGLFAACEPKEDPARASSPAPSLFEDADTKGPEEAPPPTEPRVPSIQFDDVTQTWSLALPHHAGRHEDRWLPEVMTGGVALLDVDRNGALDILVVDSGSVMDDVPPDAGPKLMLGDGKGGFTDATAAWGLTRKGYAMGVATGDVNNDGWVDVYITSFDATDALWLNEGGKGFVDATAQWGIEPKGWTTSAAFLDADKDGDLDLYLVRYVDYTLQDAIKCWFRNIHIYCTPAMYEAQPDRFLRNEGGTFVDASSTAGVDETKAKGLAVATGDLDDDGDTDLYVGADISQNMLLSSNGDGTFTEKAVTAGVAYSELGREEATMGVAISQTDAQSGPQIGWDIAVTNFQAEPTSLYALRERGTYRERSDAAGIGASSRARLSFGIDWLDADNDGDEDLLVANGHINDNIETFRDTVTFAQPNSLYMRVGDGAFEDVSTQAGPALQKVGVSRGLAVGDLDGDGGVDYVVVDNDDALQVGRNTTASRGHWVSLWLEGTTSNRSAIGAVVTVRHGDETQYREVRGATSYLSASDRRLHVGLGADTTIDALDIRWPDGTTQNVSLPAVDAHYHLVQGGEPAAYVPGEAVHAP